jgi:integrase
MDKAIGIAPWRLHDLRRTFATIHAQIGTPVHVTERLLNHVSGTHAGIVGVYQRHSYDIEMKIAVETYEQHLAKVLSL